MGFAEQIRELIHRLPAERQTCLFSATLPKMLVEFAQAGLSDPTLVRLDVDTKLSENLRSVPFLWSCSRVFDWWLTLVGAGLSTSWSGATRRRRSWRSC